MPVPVLATQAFEYAAVMQRELMFRSTEFRTTTANRKGHSGSTYPILLRQRKAYRYNVVLVLLRMERELSVLPSTCRPMCATTSPTPISLIRQDRSVHTGIPLASVPV